MLPMKRYLSNIWFRAGFGLLVAGIVLLIAVLVVPDGESHFNGRSARDWSQSLAGANREAAIRELVEGGPQAVPVLMEVIHDPNRRVRECAVEALGQIGPTAVEAGPGLEELLNAPGEGDLLLRAAARALARVRGKEAVPTLLVALNGKAPAAQTAAVEGFKVLGPNAASAVPKLIAMIRDGNPATANLAGVILGAIGRDGALTAILGLVRANDPLRSLDSMPGLMA